MLNAKSGSGKDSSEADRKRAGRGRWVAVSAVATAVASIDLAFALLYWRHKGLTLWRLLQGIAAGILGDRSWSAGSTSVWLGLGCHLLIAFCMVAAYDIAGRRWKRLLNAPLPWGALYGLWLYLFMNLVVLPLSALGRPTFANRGWVTASVVVHMLLGVLIALGLRSAATSRSKRSSKQL